MPNPKLFIAGAAALALFSLLPAATSWAQTKTQQGQVQAAPKPSPQKVTGREISTLIRTTLVALHQANMTGNYTVLRDLGALSFQNINSSARLGLIFTKIRQAGLDLSPAVMVDAIMSKKPVIDGNGVLHLEGYVPAQPLNIVFKMAFRFEGGRWRVFSLGVGAELPKAAAVEKKPAAAQKKASTTTKAKAKPAQTTNP
ncbi:MAG: hypothetical protein AB7F09_16905 [Parvibaculaceae bacterium]